MNISPSTKLYAVLGHPVAHSLSPRMQNAAIKSMGMDALYLAFDVPPEKLMSTLSSLSDLGFAGVNLTVPLKEVAFRGLKNLDSYARVLGSVNTIKFGPDGMKGYSTDGFGFLSAIKKVFHCSPKNISVYLLGCGGAGRAVGMACAFAGAKKISLTDVDISRAQKLKNDIEASVGKVEINIVPALRDAMNAAARDSRLVIQATPVGMHVSDKPLLDSNAFDGRQLLLDLIYVFPQTALMKIALKKGCRAANGLEMLAFQGAASLAIWTGKKAPVNTMIRELEKAVYGKCRRK